MRIRLSELRRVVHEEALRLQESTANMRKIDRELMKIDQHLTTLQETAGEGEVFTRLEAIKDLVFELHRFLAGS